MALRDRWSNRSTAGKVLIAVAGVALVVALLVGVVFAAVVGSFVFSMDSGSSATGGASVGPAASVSISVTDGTATVTHRGGDALDADRTVVVIDGERTAWTDSGESITNGDEFTTTVDNPERIDVIYETVEGTRTLATWEL
ncbi:type IV pilin [Halococcoides cellulosivorans]|nr:type IV pilin [Halococcoides cellulosivorans]